MVLLVLVVGQAFQPVVRYAASNRMTGWKACPTQPTQSKIPSRLPDQSLTKEYGTGLRRPPRA